MSLFIHTSGLLCALEYFTAFPMRLRKIWYNALFSPHSGYNFPKWKVQPSGLYSKVASCEILRMVYDIRIGSLVIAVVLLWLNVTILLMMPSMLEMLPLR